jgi:hypothetical protein
MYAPRPSIILSVTEGIRPTVCPLSAEGAMVRNNGVLPSLWRRRLDRCSCRELESAQCQPDRRRGLPACLRVALSRSVVGSHVGHTRAARGGAFGVERPETPFQTIIGTRNRDRNIKAEAKRSRLDLAPESWRNLNLSGFFHEGRAARCLPSRARAVSLCVQQQQPILAYTIRLARCSGSLPHM